MRHRSDASFMVAVAVVLLNAVTFVGALEACSGPTPACFCEDQMVTTCDVSQGIPTNIPTNTLRLDLSGLPLTVLPLSAFATLTSLTRLTIQSSSLQLLDDQATFTGLTNLQYLDLSGGSLTSISRGLFAPIPNLRTLKLRDNPLETLEEDLFSNIPNLMDLDLSGTLLSQFDWNALQSVTSLTKLDYSRIPTLTSLENSPYLYNQLAELRLAECSIVEISPGFLQSFPLLSTLSLAKNEITWFDAEHFQYTPGLTSLDLSGNNLTTVTPDLFSNIGQLSWLDLSKNRLENLDSNAFEPLTQLFVLFLYGNPMTTLPPGLFWDKASLASVILVPNNFTFGNNTWAPPSTYGTAAFPSACSFECVTCIGAGAENCCPAECLNCTSSTNCVQCANGFEVYNGLCVRASVVASESAVSAKSAASIVSITSAASAASAASVASIASAASAVSAASVASVHSPTASATPSSKKTDDSDLPTIVGAAVGGAIALLLILLLVAILRRNRSKSRRFPIYEPTVHPMVHLAGPNSIKQQQPAAAEEQYSTLAPRQEASTYASVHYDDVKPPSEYAVATSVKYSSLTTDVNYVQPALHDSSRPVAGGPATAYASVVVATNQLSTSEPAGAEYATVK
ncbi:hypothetical protein CAOG_002867 [Capsaspora owczarzaki ATCC 30864]|uniref:LRRNT domain-containing protein n=1 Tax=Capsaspora owczarzaki (strain ATCC 30864) TaxID=595528 RepID=A0A0D2WN66_CAPO3|nr:hypothetical protein CAOG_002867 [Capsaspora owczarzaki ATCC 30864]